MKTILLALGTIFLALNAFSDVLPPNPASAAENEKIWTRYCLGDRQTANIPVPNYQNEDIKSAVRKLAMVSPYSFYFYSGPMYSYELKNKNKELAEPPANFPNVKEVKDGRKNAHAFMTLLCGEFRDRPTLIKDKIRWVNRMHTLPATPQKSINISRELWPQMSAESYRYYIANTKLIFAAKEDYLRSSKYIAVMGKYKEDYPIEPFTVCETKYIFKRYVETKSMFKAGDERTLKEYMAQYKNFSARCAQSDRDYFYDFRGDSNFKPNSPESNGMIWYSSSVTNNCIRRNGIYELKETAKDKFSDPQICEKYFKNPFAYRWSAARAGLAAWLMHDKNHDDTFSNAKNLVTIIPNLEPMNKPFGFQLRFNEEFEADAPVEIEPGKWEMWSEKLGDYVLMNKEEADKEIVKIAQLKSDFERKKNESQSARYEFLGSWKASQSEFWKRGDLGFNSVVGFGTDTPNKELAYERLRNAVNRHTDWYASGYDDGSGVVREAAYSPFVASSYEMSASDAFTSPGTTVKSPSDGCKHWMFVFKLKKNQWYTTQSIASKTPVDFNRHWFDETSLGTNHLADTEHALDRLGTALEGEMDSILYLHNIRTNGEVDSACGSTEMSTDLN